MPIEIDVPDFGVVEFPDDTADDVIESALQKFKKDLTPAAPPTLFQGTQIAPITPPSGLFGAPGAIAPINPPSYQPPVATVPGSPMAEMLKPVKIPEPDSGEVTDEMIRQKIEAYKNNPELLPPNLREEFAKLQSYEQESAWTKVNWDAIKLAREGSRGISGAMKGIARFMAQVPPVVTADAPPDIQTQKMLEEWRNRTPQQVQAEYQRNPLTKWSKQLEVATEKSLPDVQPFTKDRPFGALMGGIGSSLPSIAIGVVSPAAGMITASFMELSDAYDAEIERQIEANEPLDVDKAFGKAAAYSAIAGGIEAKLGVGRVSKMVRKHFGGAGERALLEGGINGFRLFAQNRVNDFGAGWLEEASQRLAQDLIVHGKMNTAATLTEGFVGGGAQAVLLGFSSLATRGATDRAKLKAEMGAELGLTGKTPAEAINRADVQSVESAADVAKNLGLTLDPKSSTELWTFNVPDATGKTITQISVPAGSGIEEITAKHEALRKSMEGEPNQPPALGTAIPPAGAPAAVPPVIPPPVAQPPPAAPEAAPAPAVAPPAAPVPAAATMSIAEVEKALREGTPIAPEVMALYPDIQMKDQRMRESLAAGLTDEDISVTVTPDEEFKGKVYSGVVQVDEGSATRANNWSSNPEALRNTYGRKDIPTTEELKTLPMGRYTLKQAKEMLAAKQPAAEAKPLSAREQYDQLVNALKAETDLAKKFEIQRQIEELKNKNGGMPPPAAPEPATTPPAATTPPPAAPAPGQTSVTETAPEPVSVASIQKSLNVTEKQATAIMAVIDAMGLPKHLINIARGGQATKNALKQVEQILTGKIKAAGISGIEGFKHWAAGKRITKQALDKASDKEIVNAIVGHTAKELTAWEKIKGFYKGFYDEDIPNRVNTTLQRFAQARYGRKLTPAEINLWHLLGAFASGGASPASDANAALHVLDRYIRTGELSGRSGQPKKLFVGGVQQFYKNGAPIYVKDAQGKIEESQIVKRWAAQSFEAFKELLAKMGSLEKTMEWLASHHTPEEFQAVTGLRIVPDQLDPHENLTKDKGGFGIFAISGAKQGSYFLNRIGNYSTVTKDLWYARTMARMLGLPLTTSKGELVSQPWELNQKGIRLRRLADQAWEEVARRYNTTPAIVQQRMWDLERRLYEKLGISKRIADTQGLYDGILRKAVELDPTLTELKIGVPQAPTETADAGPETLMQKVKGSVEFLKDSGKALIRGFAASDVSTGIHEVSHVARRFLFDRNIPAENRLGITDEMITAAEEWAGAKNGVWDRKSEEKFARGFERYMRDGMAPNDGLKSLFEKIAQWLQQIYTTIAGSPLAVKISPEMQQAFNALMTRSQAVEAAAAAARPAAAPTPAVAETVEPAAKPLKKAEQRIQELQDDLDDAVVNDDKGRVKKIAQRAFKEKLLTENRWAEVQRVAKDRDMGASDVADEVTFTPPPQGELFQEEKPVGEKTIYGVPESIMRESGIPEADWEKLGMYSNAEQQAKWGTDIDQLRAKAKKKPLGATAEPEAGATPPSKPEMAAKKKAVASTAPSVATAPPTTPPAQPVAPTATVPPAPPAVTPPTALPSGPVAVTGGVPPTPNVVRRNRDFHWMNNLSSGQWTFYFGRLGEAARKAWTRMATGEYRMRQNIQRDIEEFVEGTLEALPRNMRREGGRAFFDVLDGQTMAQITTRYQNQPGGQQIIEQARRVKERLEAIRQRILTVKRESYMLSLMAMTRANLEITYQNRTGQAAVPGMTKSNMANQVTAVQFPDTWGISDGSYMPHLFRGQYRITYVPGPGQQPQFAGMAHTEPEAQDIIAELVRTNPAMANTQFTINQNMVVPGDMVRLGNAQFWRMMQQIEAQSNQTITGREAVQGILGRKASKQKWWGSLRQRFNYQGYEKDYEQVMSAYLSGFHRWLELSQVNRDVQPLLEEVRREGRPQAAQRLQDILDNLWGKPATTTVQFDNLIRTIPGLRGVIQPLALDRWSRFAAKLVTNLTLITGRFFVVNRLQPLLGLYPLVGERIIVQAKALQVEAFMERRGLRPPGGRGQQLLDAGGVTFSPGQYAVGGSVRGRLERAREALSGERSNQELAYIAMYLVAERQGMTGEAAHRYAKLRGQLFTQFSPMITDAIPSMEGPFRRIMFQFKRFPLKQYELLRQMAVEGRGLGWVRFLAGQALIGGLSVYMRQAWQREDKRYRLRKRLVAEYGDKVADVIYYGLPGLVGADMSGSLVLFDEPFGQNAYERGGRLLFGAGPNLAYEAGRAALATSKEPQTAVDRLKNLMRKFPSLRQLAEAHDLFTSNTDVMTPDGEVKYRKKITDTIAGMGSFRSANEANIRMQVNAIIQIEKETSKILNEQWVARQSGDTDAMEKAQKEVDDFNERWPEFFISGERVQNYNTYRRSQSSKTELERTSGKRFRHEIPESQYK